MAAVAQRESHALGEWLEHYIGEGASHFYLVNDDAENSTEREMFDYVLGPYVDAGLVTTFYLTTHGKYSNVDDWVLHVQVKYMSDPVLKRAQKDNHANWLLVVDLDEFAYGRKGFTLAQHYQGAGPAYTQICSPWLTYGTSGLQYQPISGSLLSMSVSVDRLGLLSSVPY